MTPQFWQGKHVLVTGHTGFKGAWLALLLERLGARVSGLALPPEHDEALSVLARPPLAHEALIDLREPAKVEEFVTATRPDIVIHLAAQSLVRPSYEEPVDTFAVNVMGTAHLLEAVRATPSVRTVVVATTDKVYENPDGERQAFVEDDKLGGHDPYAASKACTELLVQSYRRSFFSASRAVRLSTARAGNVIGGGDWSGDRIVPDIVRAAAAGQPVELRYPNSVRPWQHVLEPLTGYLLLAERLAAAADGEPVEPGLDAVNFGPDAANFKTVAELVEAFAAHYGSALAWRQAPGEHPHEAGFLTLASARAGEMLDWHSTLGFGETVEWTARWYQALANGDDMAAYTRDQIERFCAYTPAKPENRRMGAR